MTFRTEDTFTTAGHAALRVVARAGLIAYLRSLAGTLQIAPRQAYALVQREVSELDLDEIFDPNQAG